MEPSRTARSRQELTRVDTGAAKRQPDAALVPNRALMRIRAAGGGVIDPKLRAQLEDITGLRLPRLRIRTDNSADELARSVGADAVTARGEVLFRRGRFDPDSPAGVQLLGHELGHAGREPGALRASNGALGGDRVAEDRADGPGAALADASSPKASWSALSAAYFTLVSGLAVANASSVTPRRREIMADVTAQWGAIGPPGQLSHDELALEWETYHAIRDDVAIEASQARETWGELVLDYEAELSLLAEEGDRRSSLASEILQRQYQDSAGRVDAVGNYLVTGDFLGLAGMLVDSTHLRRADVLVRREEEELAAAEAELAALGDEGVPGFGRVAWQVLGWESPADFLGDVALTLATGGIGKVLRFARKSRAAHRGYRRARRAQHAVRARRVERLHSAAEQVPRAIESFQDEPALFKGFVGFIVDSAPDLTRKIATDVIATSSAGTISGGSASPDVLATAISQTTNEYVAAMLDGMGITDTKDAETKAFRGAMLLFFAGDQRLGRSMLRHYLGMNFKRRGLVNVVHVSMTSMAGAVGRLVADEDVQLDVRGALTKVATATTGEMLEDLAKQTGAVSEGFTLALGTVRKTLQKLVESALSD